LFLQLQVAHHQHMDNINGVDAKKEIYPKVLELLGESERKAGLASS
jgi:hypothetical protein